jgi:hypothetical protein
MADAKPFQPRQSHGRLAESLRKSDLFSTAKLEAIVNAVEAYVQASPETRAPNIESR